MSDGKERWMIINQVPTKKRAENLLKKWKDSKFGDLDYEIKPFSTNNGFYIRVKLPKDVDTNPRYKWSVFRDRVDFRKKK
jgi:hypothetical protein